jgi:gliding motility-associated-like protein
VDVSAPGVNIYSSLPYAPFYGYKSGTSMACPLVASNLALMLCRNPNLSPDDLKACLLNNTDNIDGLNPSFTGLLGSGRINAYKSLLCVKTILAGFTSNKTQICPGQSVQFLQDAKPFPQTVSWRFPGGIPFTSTNFNPTVTYNNEGKYDIQIIVSDGTSFDTLVLQDYITVKRPTAIISGNRTVVQGAYTNIRVDLEGLAPYEIEYTDGTNNFMVSGIYQNPYYIILRIDQSTTFNLVSVKDHNCVGTVSGSAVIDIQTGNACAPNSSFTNIIGSNTSDIGSDLLVLDSFIYMVGRSSFNSNGGEDGILLKYSLDGSLIWSKSYGGAGNDYFSCIIEGHNKKIFIGGATRSHGTITSGRPNALYMLVDTSGNVLQSGIYATTGENYIHKASKTSDGGYILGSINFFSATNSQSVVIKVDSNLNHQWGRQLTVGEFSLVFGICEIEGVGYYAANSYRHTSSPRHFDAVITKISYNGTVQWSKYFGGPNNEAMYCIKAGLNNEIWAYGHYRVTSLSDVLFARLDTNGVILSCSRIHSPLEDVSANSGFFVDTSGNIITTSYVNMPNNKYDIKVAALSPNGEILWQTGLGTVEHDNPGGVFMSGDNIYFTGSISNSRFGNNDIVLSKINCAGVNNCLESDVFYTRDTLPLTSFNLNVVSVSNVNNTQKLTTVSTRSITLNNEPLCPECNSNGSNTFNKVLADSFLHTPKALHVSKFESHTLTASSGRVNPSGHRDVFVNKVGQSGALLWSIRLQGQNFDGNSRFALSETADGSVYLSSNSSTTSSNNGTIFIAKISASGALNWSKNIPQSSNQDNPASMIFDDKGGLYLLSSYNQTASAGNTLISKLDSSGAIIWERNLNVGGKSTAQKIIALNNQIFYALSQTNLGTGSNNPMITKFDSSGQIHWNKLIPYSGASIFLDITLSADSSRLVLAGNNTTSSFGGNDILVSVFDTALAMVWSNYYGATGQDFAVSVIAHNDGYIVSGNTLSYDGNTPKQILLNIALNGTRSWTKIYGNPRSPSSFAQGANPLAMSQDGNLFTLYKDSTLGSENVGIAKLDNCGNSFCHFNQIIPDQKAFNPTVATNQSFTLQAAPGLNNFSITASPHNIKDTFLCAFIPAPPPDTDTCVWQPGFLADADCYNLPVFFRDTTIIAAGQIFQRRWILGDGNEILGGQELTYKYDIPGSYWVGLEIIGLNSDNRICKGLDSLLVIVPSDLFVDYIDTAVICASDSALLINTRISCWELPIRASWSPSIGLSDTSILEPKASPPMDQWYYVTVTDRNGNPFTDSVFVQIDYGCCKSHASFSVDKEVFCLADSILFTNTSDAMANAVYEWEFGPLSQSGAFSGANPPKQVFTQAGNFNVMLALSDGCGVDTFFKEIIIMENPYMGFALDTTLCFPDTIQIGGQGVSQNQYWWKPVILPDSTDFNPTVIVDRDTIFTITMRDYITQCVVSDTIKIAGIVPQKVLPNDTIICETNSLSIASNMFAPEYLWNTGDTTQSIIASAEGIYRITMFFKGCSFSDSIQITHEKMSAVAFSLPNDTTFCSNNNFVIMPNKVLFQPIWQDNSTLQTLTVNQSGLYWVQDSGLACVFRDSISLLFENPNDFVFDLGEDKILCKGDSILLFPDRLISMPLWSTGDTSQTIYASAEGTYKLSSRGLACIFSDSMFLTLEDPENLRFSLGNDTGFCDLSPFVITPSRFLNNPIWNDGSTLQTNIDINGGLYWVTDVDNICQFTDSIRITRSEIPEFSLGSDTFVCENQSITLMPDIDVSSFDKIWDDSSTNDIRIANAPGTYFLNVKNSFCEYTDSIEVELKVMPVIYMPSDTTFCSGDTLVLDAFHPEFEKVIWQLLVEEAQFAITKGGSYMVETKHICGDTTYMIEVEEAYCNCELYVPTAFSPNDDGLNDVFVTSFCEMNYFKLEIYNRWGTKLFESEDITKGWDGTYGNEKVANGSYMWIITLQTPYYNNNKAYQKTGVVHLVK